MQKKIKKKKKKLEPNLSGKKSKTPKSPTQDENFR